MENTDRENVTYNEELDEFGTEEFVEVHMFLVNKVLKELLDAE